MLFDQAPADTVKYLVMGYAVFFTVMIIYIASLVLRYRKAESDLEVLQELDQREE